MSRPNPELCMQAPRTLSTPFPRIRARAGLLAAAVLLLTAPIRSADWPAWRGPGGQGLTTEKDLPLRWSADEGVLWKLDLPGPGNSTPIVWKNEVFFTQATEGGKVRSLWCVDRKNGSVAWKRDVRYEEIEPTHDTNLYCSASPVTDGARVIAFHGSAGVFAYDLDGKELWRRDLGKFHHIWGNAASPVIHGDLCILNCGPGARTFLAALDKSSGEKRWQVDIPGGLAEGDAQTWTGSWSTPLVIEDAGSARILASYPLSLRSFEVRDGKEVWRCGGLGNLVYTTPLHSDGVVVAMSGFMGPALAVRTGGTGEVSADRRLWHIERSPQRVGSGVIHRGHIYIVNDSGVGQCLELTTGKEIWKERVSASSWSSLVLTGDGLLYGCDQEGKFFVLRADPRFELIAENPLRETTRASIAVSDGQLFLRTHQRLWCIGKRE
jgi:outer membrane protein assembly factor BamB